MKRKLLMLIALLYVIQSTAQTENTTTTPEEQPTKGGFLGGWSISVGAGTLGFGGTINKRLSPHFATSLGYYSSNLNQNVDTKFNSDAVTLKANIKLGAAVLLFDYYPSVNSSFRICFGAAYNLNNYKVDITPKGNQSYGYISYTPDQVGTISFDITGANVAPYLGIGFGRAVPKHRVGVGFDMGAFYHGTPTTKLSATGTFEPSANADNQAIVQKAFEGYNFYPFINLKLNIKISK